MSAQSRKRNSARVVRALEGVVPQGMARDVSNECFSHVQRCDQCAAFDCCDNLVVHDLHRLCASPHSAVRKFWRGVVARLLDAGVEIHNIKEWKRA